MGNELRQTLLSFSEIKAEFALMIRNYWQHAGWKSEVTALTIKGKWISDTKVNQIVDDALTALLHELLSEPQYDMRNMGPLDQTESVLRANHIDERHSHDMAEHLFDQVVTQLGNYLPNLTFQNHEGYQFKVMRHDLLIIKL